jgi:hypothetical protein
MNAPDILVVSGDGFVQPSSASRAGGYWMRGVRGRKDTKVKIAAGTVTCRPRRPRVKPRIIVGIDDVPAAPWHAGQSSCSSLAPMTPRRGALESEKLTHLCRLV